MTRWWPIPLLFCAALAIAALDRDAGLQSWWSLRASLAELNVERTALRAEVEDGIAELTLKLTPEAQRERIHFFYYSDGQIHALQGPP